MSEPQSNRTEEPNRGTAASIPDKSSHTLSDTERSSRNWAMFCHLSAVIGLVINLLTFTLFLPIGFLGPLIVWLIKKNEYPAADENGREATNFQITMAPIQFACTIIPLIGWLFLPFVMLANLGITVFGAVKASNGETYRYPFSLRLLN